MLLYNHAQERVSYLLKSAKVDYSESLSEHILVLIICYYATTLTFWAYQNRIMSKNALQWNY
jgi:hypothetical protein